MSVQPARRIAFDVVRAVSESDAYANLLLPVRLERAKLHGPDAALATELVYGTLRRQGYYDRVIEVAAGRPVTKIDPAILDVLRIATHQVLSLRVAHHAAVDEAVSLARTVGSRSATGFVNAVLRTITRSSADDWLARIVGTQDAVDDRLAAEYSHPAWIVRAFRQALSSDGREDELEELLDADNVAPRVSLVALPGLSQVAEIEGAVPSTFSPFGAVSPGGDPSRWSAIRDGRARVQDEGSQLAALALSRALPIRAGERWLDVCAGPGGKSALLAAEALPYGAAVVANEVIPARAKLVRDAVSVFADPPQVLVGDGRELGKRFPGQFDRVLLDAPCTGLGALRRRPEARWRKLPSDVPELTKLQLELVASAVEALAPGGILCYVTCSPHPAETRAVVSEAIKRFGLEAQDTPAVLATIVNEPLRLSGSTSAQLWPHRHGTDAMFIALLRKPDQ